MIIFKNVDLPSPFAPTRPMCSPLSRRKEAFSRICLAPKPWLTFVTVSKLILVSCMMIDSTACAVTVQYDNIYGGKRKECKKRLPMIRQPIIKYISVKISENSLDLAENPYIFDDDRAHGGVFRLKPYVAVFFVKGLDCGFALKSINHGNDYLAVAGGF